MVLLLSLLVHLLSLCALWHMKHIIHVLEWDVIVFRATCILKNRYIKKMLLCRRDCMLLVQLKCWLTHIAGQVWVSEHRLQVAMGNVKYAEYSLCRFINTQLQIHNPKQQALIVTLWIKSPEDLARGTPSNIIPTLRKLCKLCWMKWNILWIQCCHLKQTLLWRVNF